MNKKENLIKALKVAVNALENGTVFYNWIKPCSCNCGVVAQAILGKTRDDVKTAFMEIENRTKPKRDDKTHASTWKEGVQYLCSITGKTDVSIFNELFSIGMSPEDITHLEFLENPAILKRANLETEITTTTKIKTGETIKKVPVVKKEKRFWRNKNVITYENQVEETFETKTTKENKLEKHYYCEKNNLIKYLKAWVSILEENAQTVTKDTQKITLREELLKAVASENYEEASKIRDMISVLP